MSKINLNTIKQLRNETAVSIMQCKKALEEAGGDLEKAKIVLTKKSGEIAVKKSDRDLNSGIIISEIDNNNGVIMEIACETDFVAKNEDFKIIAQNILEQILLNGWNKDSEEIKKLLMESTQKFGERIDIIKLEKLSGNLNTYIHSNNLVGALVSFKDETIGDLGKDISMHISAQNPKYLKTEDIDSREREKAEEILRKEIMDKPAEMQEKILEGKMNAYFKERVLLTQVFIKDTNKTIKKLLEEKNNEIVSFIRLGVGE